MQLENQKQPLSNWIKAFNIAGNVIIILGLLAFAIKVFEVIF